MMLQSFDQVSARMLHPGTSSIFKTQQQGSQTHPTICDMLRSNVAIVWPELANTGPTMLRQVMLKCCDRQAGALDGKAEDRRKKTEQFPMPMPETDTEDYMAGENGKQESG